MHKIASKRKKLFSRPRAGFVAKHIEHEESKKINVSDYKFGIAESRSRKKFKEIMNVKRST